MPFQTHEQNGLVWLTSPILDQYCNIRHAFSTRKGGVSVPPWDSLNLGPSRGDNFSAVEENYRRFCEAAGFVRSRLVLSKQVHETTVRICTSRDAGKGLYQERDYTADALITNEINLPLVVFSADCGIILLYAPVQRAIGAVHAGWRGCAGGIVEKAVGEMRRVFGTNPADIHAAIGPCIGQCCFETDADVPNAMLAALDADAAPYLEQRGSKYHVDLAGLNRFWLLRTGLRPKQIDVCGLCTACRRDLFWSHRKMGDSRGVQVAVISLSEKGACL